MYESFGAGSGQASRLLAGAAALMLFTAGACGAGTPSASPGATPSAPGAVSIPTGNLTAYDRCMLDAGEEIVGFDPGYPGLSSGGYIFRMVVPGGLDDAELQANIHQCDALQPSPPPPLTEAEIRGIYDRWVGEYHCLIGLGYQPDSPPSVETFVASWNTPRQGPWMPADGIDTDRWTDAEFKQAKAKCTLEFLLAPIPAP